MRRQVSWALAATGVMAVGASALSVRHTGYHAELAGTAMAASVLSPATAAIDAVHAVGGGYATHTSFDRYHGVPVYDVHVAYQNTVWDVKVGMTGAILQKRLASEQPGGRPPNASGPSAVTAPQNSPATFQKSGSTVSSTISSAGASAIAVHAVGGGVVSHISADHVHGAPVWDVHVLNHQQLWDIKVNQSTGAIMEKKLAREQTAKSEGQGPSPDSNGKRASDSPDQPATVPGGPAGVVLGQKMAAPPSVWTPDVTQAMSAVHGLTLKWVKFSQEGRGNYQMAMKIRLANGTVKVKDTFDSQGRLIAQKISSDN
ncbi:MAG: PepSY domain-containing protein [Firmicutes bacterium]|nr:PepSY domain-containing protein [Bacillota bacterium]